MVTSSNWRVESGSPLSSPSPTPSPTFDNVRLAGETDVEANNQPTKEVFRDVVKGRKSWKTLKGGEMVWPPELEAALLEGLASYQPDDSRETRLLGRFPMRNRYISAYIAQKTGKHRTAKQVGSRLQQLRDTCGTKKLQHLLSPSRKGEASEAAKMFHYNSLERYGLKIEPSSPTQDSDPTSPVSDVSDSASMSSVMYICILPHATSYDSRLSIEDSSSISSIGAETRPRSIYNIDPTLTFASSTLLDQAARSIFEVYHSEKHVVHREECPLLPSPLSAPDEEGQYFYSASLIPGFWDTICSDPDPTSYTIKHRVVRDITLAQSPLFSAVYKFRYPFDAPSHRGRMASTYFDSRTSHHSTLDQHAYSFDCSSTSEDPFDVGNLSEMAYGHPPMSSILNGTCYQNESGSVSPRSEASDRYVRRGSASLSPPPPWFFSQPSRPNY